MSGEPLYKPEFDPVTNSLRRDYAQVLMLPNEQRDQRILLVYGIYTQGSQAAGLGPITARCPSSSRFC